MRILAIRGRNLASLAGDFAIDFQQEPLASAGLYAISGPTGSGKSTLLDALCLALYADTPRLARAEARGHRVPDGDVEQGLLPDDPRTLLRRGCTEAHAEADFVGIDGTLWRARWAVRRAHGRSTGTLQSVERSLNRLVDGQAWSGHKKELQAEIIRLTGLDFTQFCRSVLLAQGEFAALLKAKPDERGQLLEALTGTAIFQQLSKAAHERARQARAEEDALRQALGQHAPLDPETRAALDIELAGSRDAAELARAELQALETEARWHAEGAQLGRRQAALDAERASVESRLTALDVPALEAAASARKLAAPLAALDAASHRLAERTARRAQAAEALTEREAALLASVEHLQRTEAQLQTRREARRAAEPALIAARAADAELTRLTREHAALAAPRTDSTTAITALQTEQTAITVELERLHLGPQRYAEWLATHPAWADPALDWNGREAALVELLRLTHRRAALQQELAALAATLAQAEAQHAEAQAAVASASAAVDAAATERQARAAELAAGDGAETLEALTRALEARQRQLDLLEQAWADTLCREQDAIEARRVRLAAEASARTAEAQQLAAAEVETRAEADVAALRRSLDRLKLRADAHTELLRQSLVAGEPCPVCGATEHPGTHAEPTTAGVLAALATELAAAEHGHREARGLREQHALAAARAAQAAEQDSVTAERTRQAASTARDSLRLQISEWAPAAQMLPLGPEDLAPFRTELIAEREVLAQRMQARANRVSALERTRTREDEARQQLSAALAARDARSTALAAPRERRARGAGELDNLQLQLTALQHALPSMLAHADQAALEDGLRVHRDGAALKSRSEADTARRAERLQQGERLTQALAHQQQRAAELDAREAGLIADIAAAREARQQALAVDDTEAHAAALDATVREAELTVTAARHAHAEALQARERHLATLADLTAEAAAAQAAAAEREQALHQALAGWQPDRPAVQALLELRTRLAALPNTLDADLAVLTEGVERRRRLAVEADALRLEQQRWADRADSARNADAVAEASSAASARLGELQARLGALRHQLDEDEARRARFSQQSAELDATKLANRRWHQLGELIGAHDGSSFRQYAQQFTLEVLVEHANAHLAELAPRYRLAAVSTALGLQMIDTDFGDERRSVHSLSGGESFLVSLALALGLASMAAERIRVESLFIDEGFGSLDAQTLAVALNALDRLQAQGRRIGVISHVPDMADRIGVQVRVRPRGAGRSGVEVVG